MTTTTMLASDSGRQGRVHYTNRDLPAGALDRNMWRCVFISTYSVYVANYPNPWSVDDEDAVVALQHIWNAVYTNRKLAGLPDIPYTVEYQDCVFSIVCFIS